MNFGIIIFTFVWNLIAGNLYPSYSLSKDPTKVLEWSENHVLAYIITIRLFDNDHHIFQYRRYPCQYFYTDEIQLNHNNETINQCVYNTTTSHYEYSFQLHLHSLHVEPFILRNIALQCHYINCSLSLLKLAYIHIGWNLKGREHNPNCSFDINHPYNILHTPHTISEWITLRCESLSACNHSKLNLEQSLTSNIQLIYGSSYDLEVPYCSLEKSLSHVIDTNLAQTNRLLQQLLELIQRGFGRPDEREQARLKEYVEHLSSTTTDTAVVQNNK